TSPMPSGHFLDRSLLIRSVVIDVHIWILTSPVHYRRDKVLEGVPLFGKVQRPGGLIDGFCLLFTGKGQNTKQVFQTLIEAESIPFEIQKYVPRRRCRQRTQTSFFSRFQ